MSFPLGKTCELLYSIKHIIHVWFINLFNGHAITQMITYSVNVV